VKVEGFHTERNRHPELDGFDAALDFQPDWGSLPPPLQPHVRWKLLNKLGLARPHSFRTNRIFSYRTVAAAMLARPPVPCPRFPCVTPAWVNIARRRHGGATILYRSTPAAYGHLLRTVLANQQTIHQVPEPFVFINAWNEWAVGNHFEPDIKWQHSFLEETHQAITSNINYN
jgi:hypothetical protein